MVPIHSGTDQRPWRIFDDSCDIREFLQGTPSANPRKTQDLMKKEVGPKPGNPKLGAEPGSMATMMHETVGTCPVYHDLSSIYRHVSRGNDDEPSNLGLLYSRIFSDKTMVFCSFNVEFMCLE